MRGGVHDVDKMLTMVNPQDWGKVIILVIAQYIFFLSVLEVSHAKQTNKQTNNNNREFGQEHGTAFSF